MSKMRGMGTIAERELSSYFRQPAGWLIIAFYLFLTGVIFSMFVLHPGQPATMRSFFAFSGWLLLPVAPAISMRLISEELRSGTIESLLTSPISASALVLGKFLGAFGFLLAMLAPTLLYVALLDRVSKPQPDIGPLVAGYVCLVLLGILYLAIGVLASSLTNNSTLAFLMTLFTILALLFVNSAAQFVPDMFKPALFSLSLVNRVGDFAKGIIDTAHIVFFLSTSAWFLFLAVSAVELRRTR